MAFRGAESRQLYRIDEGLEEEVVWHWRLWKKQDWRFSPEPHKILQSSFPSLSADHKRRK
jgi:hypothetical protein